jgi:hypothetical protein
MVTKITNVPIVTTISFTMVIKVTNVPIVTTLTFIMVTKVTNVHTLTTITFYHGYKDYLYSYGYYDYFLPWLQKLPMILWFVTTVTVVSLLRRLPKLRKLPMLLLFVLLRDRT